MICGRALAPPLLRAILADIRLGADEFLRVLLTTTAEPVDDALDRVKLPLDHGRRQPSVPERQVVDEVTGPVLRPLKRSDPAGANLKAHIGTFTRITLAAIARASRESW